MMPPKNHLLLALVAGLLAKSQADVFPPPDSNPLTWGFYSSPEFQQPTELEIEGTIPTWLSGSLYRGAAATWDVGNFTAEHWFDGFSRNHRFEIANGVVTYQSRNASDELMDFVRETGQYPTGSFGNDPCKIIFGALETKFRNRTVTSGDKSKSNINVAWIPNYPGLGRNTSSEGGPFVSLVTTTEANPLQQIDPITLEPIELFAYSVGDSSKGGMLKSDSGRLAAHPAHGSDGSICNYQLDISGQPPTYQIFCVDPTGEVNFLAEIKDAPPAYIHTLFSTENYLILVVWQADYTKQGYTILSSLGPWNPDRKTLFYVISKADGRVSKYISDDAFFAFHEVNSFEDETGAINIDLPRMDNLDFLTAANLANLRANLGNKADASSKNDAPGTFTRYRLPAYRNTSFATNGTLLAHRAETMFSLPYAETNIELARINEEYAGRPYRYTWGIHVEKTGYFADSLIKLDTVNREWKVWSPATEQLPSEPIFVASPEAQVEDDGVLLFIAMDSAVRKSSLVVVNATTMEEMGRARMPIVMSYGFHGIWGGNTSYSNHF
ncbi:carotenoid oxygenase [Hypoxylon trugodes]|uniref:carotenoid oxygenase n=1 Tax=Hypoxylon trugodes TaxID=326681 RepID=UPI0021A23780|nr:carotenoid oxygenase [Hypoxylon trugodes]KAI1394163.1 carotenoid oxygenase [Hypoxylon trugodes]